MGKRGPLKGSRYHKPGVKKSRYLIYIPNDLRAWIRKVSKECHLSESSYIAYLIKKDLEGKKGYLTYMYKKSLAEVEMWRHMLASYNIDTKEVVIEDE